MKVIVGLGNPGADYEGTRHNIGFELLDRLAHAHGIKFERDRLVRALLGKGQIAGETVLLVKPQTYMNESGITVGGLLRRHEFAPETDVLVACDDIHLPVGKIRLRASGSSGGQNGLKSIALHLATQEWARLRIGVGEPPPGLQVEWVLGKFTRTDRVLMDETLILSMGAVEYWLTNDIGLTMTRYNGLSVTNAG